MMKLHAQAILMGVFLLVLAPHSTAASRHPAQSQVFQTRGVVREIAPNRRTARIRHETIPGYMAAMTMEFNLKDSNDLAGVTVGDTITFRLTVVEDTHWIDQVHKVAPADRSNPPTKVPLQSTRTPELKPGDLLPDFSLTEEHGRPIRFSHFRGQSLALTFIFTRCPLPDYCPRMGKQFAAASELLKARAGAPTNWHLLSISFDPDVDTPSVLREYAKRFRKDDRDRWLFAVASQNTLAELAPRLDLIIQREPGGGISHNLRTVVLNPQGRIHRQFDGTDWTPQQLADAVLEAAGVGP